MIEPTTHKTAMTTTATVTSTATTTTKKRTTNKKNATTNYTKKKKKIVTNKQVTNARNKVVLNLERNLQPSAKGKRASFTEEEDRMLTKAYVNVTQDEKVGCICKEKVYWNKVKDKFDGTSYRSWSSQQIQSRFSKKLHQNVCYF